MGIDFDSGIHTSALVDAGWARSGCSYTKGGDKIYYDGCWWWMNGIRIYSMDDINKKNESVRK